MKFTLTAPNGKPIIGTLEELNARSDATEFELIDGELAPDYDGNTDMWYDGQRTVTDDAGNMILLDGDGNEWTLDQCTRTEVT